MSSRNFKSPPVMREDMTYEDWKSDVEIWSDFTDLEPEKKGSAVFLTLVGKSQQTVRAGVTRAEMKSAAGLQKVLTCLDELYKKDEASSGFSAYEDFSDYRRPAGVSIKDYLVEFNLKYSKLKAYKMELPEGVLAYYVLKCASLTDEQTNICKATCTDLKYSDMKKQIEKVTSNSGRADKHSQDISVQSQFYMDGEVDYVDECYYEGDHGVGTESAECDTYYVHPGQSTLQYQYRPGGSRRGMSFSQRGATMTSGPRLNTPDEFGNPTRCVSAKVHITMSDSVRMQRNRRQYEDGVHPPSGGLGVEACAEVEEDTSDMRIAQSRMSFYWQKINYTKLNFWGKLSVMQSSIVVAVERFVVDRGWSLISKHSTVVKCCSWKVILISLTSDSVIVKW